MLQEILMWISVLGAFSYTVYSFVKIIFKSFTQKEKVCSSMGCSGCSDKKEILKHINIRKLSLVPQKNR